MSFGSNAGLVEELRRKLEQFQQRGADGGDGEYGESRMEAIAKMGEEIRELSATASSPDGSVIVVAGPGGGIQSVKITEDGLRHGAARLSSNITATIQQAVAAAARQQATIVQAYSGDNANVLDRVLETQAASFGMSVEELKAGMAEAAPSARPSDTGDDFSEDNFLKADDRPQPSAPPSSGSPADSFLKHLFDEEGS